MDYSAGTPGGIHSVLTLWLKEGLRGQPGRGVWAGGGGERHSLRQVSKLGIGKLREIVKQQFTAI